MPSENVEGLILCIVLLFVTVDTYRAKMAIQKPVGFCLVLFKAIYFSFGLMFLSAGILCLVTSKSVAYYLAYFCFFCVLVGGFGIIFWNLNNCSKK
jgi:hypothetical protein